MERKTVLGTLDDLIFGYIMEPPWRTKQFRYPETDLQLASYDGVDTHLGREFYCKSCRRKGECKKEIEENPGMICLELWELLNPKQKKVLWERM